MEKRVDLVGATRRSAGVQGGASGLVELRGAASRSAASPLTARNAARLTVLRTAQPANRLNARASAGSLLLQAQRVNSNVRSECAWGTVTGDGNAKLRGRLTRLWTRPATVAAPRMMTMATQAQSAGRGDLSRDGGEGQRVARVVGAVEVISVRGKAYRSVELR